MNSTPDTARSYAAVPASPSSARAASSGSHADAPGGTAGSSPAPGARSTQLALGLWLLLSLPTWAVGGTLVGSVTVGPQSPNPVVVPNSASFTVTVNRTSGSTGAFSANLSLTGLRLGTSASFSPNPISFSATDNSLVSTLTISTSCNTPGGTGNVTVKAANTANSSDSATGTASLAITPDTTPPILSCPPTVTVLCASAVPPRATSLSSFLAQGGTASDNCGGLFIGWLNDVTNALSCPNRFTITRTYAATDVAGNTATCNQTIVVDAILPPLITAFPSDLTFGCAGQVPLANNALVTAAANCGGPVTISHDPDVISNQTCPNHFTITRTYHATDACGNVSSQSQTINVNDTVPPAITTFPADVTVSCASAVPPANDSLVTATDNCGGSVAISHDPDAITPGTCAGHLTIRRSYHATDACGNVTTQTQTIAVDDETAPTITTFPADTAVNCANAVPAADDTFVQAIDNCGGAVSVTHDADVITNQTCPNRYTITRTYHAADLCGNTVSQSQTITVNDTNSPLFTTFPADLTVSCASAVPPADDTAITATDNCGSGVIISHDADVVTSQSCPDNFTLTRTYHATDACGNVASRTQTITVSDTVPPVITAFPADLTVTCATAVAPADDTTVSATDNCGGPVTISHDPDAISNQVCPNQFTITRTYHATDACGNVSSQSQTITISDTVPPLITTFPADLSLSCASAVPPANDSLVAATDNCGGPVSITHDPDTIIAGSCAGHLTIQRAYHVIDSCGNVAAQVQTITVDDETAPTINSFPADATVSCASAVPAADDTLVQATDNCGGAVSVTHDADVITNQTCPNRYTITRTYHAADLCGNTVSQNQTITVNDTNPPVVTAGTIAACYSSAASAQADALAATTASDGCSGTPTLTAVVNGTCDAVVTVTAADACGNSASVVYHTRIDGNPPVVTAGSIASCFPSQAAAEAAALAATTVTDDCSAAPQVNVTTTGACTATITVSAADDCGNVASVVYHTRIDNIPPALTGCPPDANYSSFGDVPPPAQVTANDDCDGSVPVSFTQTQSASASSCTNTIIRTWTATDSCGNITSCTQTILVSQGGGTPNLTLLGANPMITILDGPFLDPGYTATDANNNPITATVSGTLATNAVGTNVLTYTATDGCGDQVVATRVVYVQYQPAGVSCNNEPSHVVLPPINPDGSSVFNHGSTIPIAFRVFDADCNSIGTPGVVVSFQLFQVSPGLSKAPRRLLPSVSSDGGFQWNPTAQEWELNVSAKSLTRGVNYSGLMILNDGSTISFAFSTK